MIIDECLFIMCDHIFFYYYSYSNEQQFFINSISAKMKLFDHEKTLSNYCHRSQQEFSEIQFDCVNKFSFMK